MPDLRLVAPALLAWGTAAWLVGQGSGTALSCAVTGVLLAAVTVPRWRAVALTAMAVGLVAACCAWRLGSAEASPLAQVAQSRPIVSLEAVVARDPRPYERFGATSSVVELRVLRFTAQHRTVAGRDVVVAFMPGRSGDLQVGERIVARGRLGPADDSGVAATFAVQQRRRLDAEPLWWRAANRVRDGVRASVERAPPDPAALVPALVDGDDADVSDDVQQDFRTAGLTHLLAVSGTNLTIVLGVVMLLLARSRAGPRLRLAVGILAVVGFVLLARPDPSVVRAAAMGVVGLVSMGLGGGGRGSGGLRVLAVAVIALVVIDPWLSREAGFVLSVCATGGIIVLAPGFSDRLARWLPRWLAVALAVPCAAQLACMPAIAALSGEVSLVAVAANLLAGPAVAPTTVLGLAGGLLDLVAPPLARGVGWAAGWGASWILLVGHRAAALDGASITWPGPWWTLLLVVALLTGALWRGLARPWLVIGAVVGLLAVMVRPPSPGWPPEGWVMVACDVGQGDATVFRIDGQRALVIDAGPEPAALHHCLKGLGVRSVPLLVFTHAHADHMAGWSGLRGRPIGEVWVGPTGGPPGLRAQRRVAGDRAKVGPLEVEVLWPGAEIRPRTSAGSGEEAGANNASLVLRVRVAGLSVLVTGDAEPDAQDGLLRSGIDPAATVLKMPHHGSGRQSERFFRAVAPRLATISVGADNDYGHPAAAALQLLQRLGIRSFRTDVQGDVAVVLRDGDLAVMTRQ